ncbi:hypothetical protein ACVINX_004854 [Bradyrhizobium diazoefficiens]
MCRPGTRVIPLGGRTTCITSRPRSPVGAVRCGSRRRRARNSGRATPSLRHEPGVALSSWSTLHFHPVRRAASRIERPHTPHNRGLRIITKVDRPRRDNDLHARRSRDHVVALTARSTSRSQAGSTPAAARTTASPISMLIVIPFRVAASTHIPAGRSSDTTGTKSGASSAGKLSRPARAALRQANRCCGERSCRRATSDTTVPGAYDSATIRPLTTALHRRRRPAPTWISTRPRGSEASTIWSTIYANLTVYDGSHVAGQLTPNKVWETHRLRSNTEPLETIREHPVIALDFGFVGARCRASIAAIACRWRSGI